MTCIADEENPPGSDPLLLSVPEVARLLGVGRTTAFALIRSREIESLKIGTRRLIPREAVEAYVRRLRARQRLGQRRAARPSHRKRLAQSVAPDGERCSSAETRPHA